jgi:hypothetical protein
MSLSRRRVLALFALALCVAPAAMAAAEEQYVVELRVIEGEKGSGDPVVDKRLSALRKDLVNLPFRNFTLKDSHTSLVQSGERVSLEIPGDAKAKGKDKGRFLVVAAHGRQPGGKLRFTLTIDAVKFDTVVSVPDGGTIIVGGPRGSSGKALLFAFTAKAKK